MRIRMHLLLLSAATLIPALPSLAEQQEKDSGLQLIPQNSQTIPQAQQQVDIHDIYPPLLLPDQIPWVPWIIAGALLIIILLLLFFYLKRKKKTVIPSVPPHITALADLQRAREYLTNNQSLIYAERISEILRRYIEKRFTISSTRQTTMEFLQAIQLAANNIGSELLPHKEELSRCMEQCDMAKYAHKTTDRANMEEMEDGVRRFIDSTKPSEEDS